MKIYWNKLTGKRLIAKARTLSTAFMIRRDMHVKFGDMECDFDLYQHSFEYAYMSLKKFLEEEGLVEYDERIDDVPVMLATFAYKNFKNPVEVEGETEDEFKAKEWMRMNKLFDGFIALIATFAYHRYRLLNVPDDREVETRNCYYSWLKLKKYNRDNDLIHGMTDEELQNTTLAWYELSVLPKNPKLFEMADVANGREIASVVKKYEGPRPNIPSSEMAEGYDFDVGF